MWWTSAPSAVVAGGASSVWPSRSAAALGALVNHITGGHLEGGGTFQPMNINYGLLPPLETPKVDHEGRKLPLKERGRAKKRLMSVRALADLDAWLGAAVADAA